MLQRVAILYNPFTEAAVTRSAELEVWLRARGISVWRGVSQEAREQIQALADADLMVAMGGDGTVLRAARLCIPLGIPVLAVALGHLSFMAEVQPEELYVGMEQLMQGGGWHDERTLISATLYREGKQIATYTALNEVVISRSEVARALNVHVSVDGSPLTTYHADGVIVATATGSTAYAMAAGGPIVDPRSRSLVLVAVAPHLSVVPSMVLHDDAVVGLRLGRHHHANLAVDGRENVPIHEDDELVVRRSPTVCTFVRLRPSSQFYTHLVARLRREG